MTKIRMALAAAIALPLSTPLLSQAPAAVDLDALRTLSGNWSYRAVQGASVAAFADASRAERLFIRCNRARRIVSVVRTGVPAAAPTLSVWTTSLSRSVPSRWDSSRNLSADLNANDPLLDALAFSRGRFATAAAGAPVIALNSSPEVDRVIEDCRS